MNILRYLFLILATAYCSLSYAGDPREKAIENAAADLGSRTEEPLRAVYFVVIGYEGNLPLFEKEIVPPPQNGTGFAVPVNSNGYFLTAAHSVLPDRDMYVMGHFDGRLRALKAEIIYRGDPSQTESDYAVLKVQAAISQWVTFAEKLPPEGETVYAVVRIESRGVLAEGVCCAAPNEYGARGSIALKSDIPVIGGDSGGPLFTKDLKLVGITSRTTRVLAFIRTQSCCPSPKIISDLIDSHTRKQPTRGTKDGS